jgi:hypothetical protein
MKIEQTLAFIDADTRQPVQVCLCSACGNHVYYLNAQMTSLSCACCGLEMPCTVQANPSAPVVNP